MKTKKPKLVKRLVSVVAAACVLVGVSQRAEAQEILLTGPLAGAPAVRKLRLYRQARFEFAPSASFTLLDEYQRTILIGARLNYNFTDWLAFGVWGAFGGVKITTHLTDEIQTVNAQRWKNDPDGTGERRLTAINMSRDFPKQLGSIQWVASPQLTAVPFRGKLALFQSVYVDSDLYFFAGPAFVGLEERANCTSQCSQSFNMASRTAIAPTFGLGFTWYLSKWSALGFEWRGLPFSWNTGGFDTAGKNPEGRFPDNKIDSSDQRFRFNQMLSVSFNIYLPTQYRISE